MDFKEYQRIALSCSVLRTPQEQVEYGVLNTASEAGEIAGKYAKSVRDQTPIDKNAVMKEMGDVLWSLAALAEGLGETLDTVAELNCVKIRSRKERGTIGGSGDDR